MNQLLPSVANPDFVDLSPLGGTKYLITVDTEEEFDWSAPFTRDNHGLTHIPAIERFQTLCNENGAQPAYLVDYPIATDAKAIEMLAGFAANNQAAIGVQLHPWVNPPFNEEINTQNSFACNLPAELEREKLTTLFETIVKNMGVNADIYRAGRYGAGQETVKILSELGIKIDSSVRSRFDYSSGGGPNYSMSPVKPYWLERDRLMELPVTTVFAGLFRKAGKALFGQIFASDTARSMLARGGLLERIALTPEGIPVEKAIMGIDRALVDNIGILNFSFHSPSLVPGFTSYVRDEDDLENFYNWWRLVFAHLKKRRIEPCTVKDISSLKTQKMAKTLSSEHLPLASTPTLPLSART